MYERRFLESIAETWKLQNPLAFEHKPEWNHDCLKVLDPERDVPEYEHKCEMCPLIPVNVAIYSANGGHMYAFFDRLPQGSAGFMGIVKDIVYVCQRTGHVHICAEHCDRTRLTEHMELVCLFTGRVLEQTYVDKYWAPHSTFKPLHNPLNDKYVSSLEKNLDPETIRYLTRTGGPTDPSKFRKKTKDDFLIFAQLRFAEYFSEENTRMRLRHNEQISQSMVAKAINSGGFLSNCFESLGQSRESHPFLPTAHFSGEQRTEMSVFYAKLSCAFYWIFKTILRVEKKMAWLDFIVAACDMWKTGIRVIQGEDEIIIIEVEPVFEFVTIPPTNKSKGLVETLKNRLIGAIREVPYQLLNPKDVNMNEINF